MATQQLVGGAGLRARAQRQTTEWRGSVLKSVNEQRLSTGLGWFSIGLGLAELLAPQYLARLIGVGERRTLIRALGVREIAAGIGILTKRRPAEFVWARVGGDAIDLSLLGAAFDPNNRKRYRTAAAIAAVAGVTLVDIFCSEQLTYSPETGYRALHVQKSMAVNRSPEEVYRFWRNFENFPRFMRHLESVRAMEGSRSRWTAHGPLGRKVEWDAELIEDIPNESIAWRSLPGSAVYNSGSVRFERAPGDRGTIVRVDLQYVPRGGGLGAIIAKLSGAEPGRKIEEDLRAFKQIAETGEIAKSDASIHSGMHPAQPQASGRESALPR